MQLTFPQIRDMVAFIKEQKIILHEYNSQDNILIIEHDHDLYIKALTYGGSIAEQKDSPQNTVA